MRTVWLLDVDGVVNIIGPSSAAPWGQWLSGRAFHDGISHPICASRTVVDFISSSHSTGADIRWLTTWGRDANRSLRDLLGLPLLRVEADEDEVTELRRYSSDPSPLSWWKLAAAERLLSGSDTRLVWTDDELASHPEAFELLSGRDCLLISPDPRHGLAPEHLLEIAAFLRS